MSVKTRTHFLNFSKQPHIYLIALQIILPYLHVGRQCLFLQKHCLYYCCPNEFFGGLRALLAESSSCLKACRNLIIINICDVILTKVTFQFVIQRYTTSTSDGGHNINTARLSVIWWRRWNCNEYVVFFVYIKINSWKLQQWFCKEKMIKKKLTIMIFVSWTVIIYFICILYSRKEHAQGMTEI